VAALREGLLGRRISRRAHCGRPGCVAETVERAVRTHGYDDRSVAAMVGDVVEASGADGNRRGESVDEAAQRAEDQGASGIVVEELEIALACVAGEPAWKAEQPQP